LVDPPVTNSVSASATQSTDPLEALLNQQLALFSQHVSAAMPSSGFSDSSSLPNSSDTVAYLSQLARSIVTQQQA
jgi:hypothetical protein